MQGWRLEMEDAHIAQEISSRTDHVFVAVFDGHGGSGAALYAEQHMIPTLERTAEWGSYVEGGATDITLLGSALKRAFVLIDEQMRRQQDSTMGQDGADTSGCTSVTAVITPTHIICANAGDSRCCLGTNGTFEPMSNDHKPYDPEEKARIEEAGGTVQWKRVDGDLAVSRALGDFQYKGRTDLPPEKQKVSCEPDIKVWPRQATDEVLLLACDGLWDVLSNQEAIDAVRAIFQSGENNSVLVAEEMIDMALEKGWFIRVDFLPTLQTTLTSPIAHFTDRLSRQHQCSCGRFAWSEYRFNWRRGGWAAH